MRVHTRRLLAHALAAAALFSLPACTLDRRGLGSPANFLPGPTPQSSVIFCDIEQKGTGFDGTSRVCADAASPEMLSSAIPLTSAATALNAGQSSMVALDKSPAAVGRCGSDGEIVQFRAPFPQGGPQCLNCGAVIPTPYADANAACVAICDDVSTTEVSNPPSSEIAAFCAAHAHASTNVPVSGCPPGFAGACTDSGTLRMDFTDPRIFPEPVVWTDLVGVAAGGTGGNDLTQTDPTTVDYHSGAASMQWIDHGDAYVEFAPGEANKTHVIGFSVLDVSAVPPDPDTDPTPADIDFAFDLGNDGRVYILQSGVLLPGPDIAESWGTYAAGDRFRLRLVDQGYQTFDVAFAKLVGSCTPGSPCNETQYTLIAPGVPGKFRVDTAFHDNGASLLNVVLTFIHQP